MDSYSLRLKTTEEGFTTDVRKHCESADDVWYALGVDLMAMVEAGSIGRPEAVLANAMANITIESARFSEEYELLLVDAVKACDAVVMFWKKHDDELDQ